MDNLFRALGDQTRLRIINLLQDRELCVCELEVILVMTQSNVSRHLSRLRSENIVAFEKKAQWIYYYIDPVFKKNHMLLLQYMREKMKDDELFVRDSGRLKCYQKSGESCETLKDIRDTIFAG